MRVVHTRCCGIAVHQKRVVACALLPEPDGPIQRTLLTVGTMTADPLALNDWLTAQDVSQGAMESTGVYTLPTML